MGIMMFENFPHVTGSSRGYILSSKYTNIKATEPC